MTTNLLNFVKQIYFLWFSSRLICLAMHVLFSANRRPMEYCHVICLFVYQVAFVFRIRHTMEVANLQRCPVIVVCKASGQGVECVTWHTLPFEAPHPPQLTFSSVFVLPFLTLFCSSSILLSCLLKNGIEIYGMTNISALRPLEV